MGRTKKYLTEEDKNNANRSKSKRWYEKNKGEHNTHRMIEYYEKQLREIQQILSELRKEINL